jgi:putative transposase
MPVESRMRGNAHVRFGGRTGETGRPKDRHRAPGPPNRVKVRKDRSVRNRACYLAVGVTVEGDREPLGIWWQDEEGSKFWLAVLNELYERGVRDVLIACVDGLDGFPEAIEAVFPQTWVQTCIVHEIRSSMRFVSYKDRKKVARDLRPVYCAPDADAARSELDAFEKAWGAQYPMIARMWRRDWEHITPFLSLPWPLRRVVYTTDESVKGRVGRMGRFWGDGSVAEGACRPADRRVERRSVSRVA